MCDMKLFIHSQSLKAQPLKFGSAEIISYQTLPAMLLAIHAGIQVNSL